MLHTDSRGAFVFVTLDAPATRNALNDAMVTGLLDALALVAAQPAVRALVIRGAHGTFCAGGDFGGFRELMDTPVPPGSTDPIVGTNRRFGALLERLQASPVAAIAVVEGAAIGGGAGLAAACDVVLAAGDARLAMPEVTLGLPPAQIAPFIAARIGRHAALRLLLTGRGLTAPQALACGLVDEVHDGVALDGRLGELLTELGRAEPAALRATKAILRRHGTEPPGATLDFAAAAFATALRSGTAAQGLAALAAKQPAPWVLQPVPARA